MLNVRFRGLEKAEKAARDKIKRAIKEPAFLNKVGNKAMANIKQDLFQGKDPNTRKQHQNKLKASTIKQRKALIKRQGAASEFYKPNRALVLTGQLIRSLAYKIRTSGSYIEFYAKGTHKKYKGSKGKTITNQELLNIHHKSRTMIGMSKAGAKSIVVIARNAIRKLL